MSVTYWNCVNFYGTDVLLKKVESWKHYLEVNQDRDSLKQMFYEGFLESDIDLGSTTVVPETEVTGADNVGTLSFKSVNAPPHGLIARLAFLAFEIDPQSVVHNFFNGEDDRWGHAFYSFDGDQLVFEERCVDKDDLLASDPEFDEEFSDLSESLSELANSEMEMALENFLTNLPDRCAVLRSQMTVNDFPWESYAESDD